MKKIGHETLFLETNENRVRCGESTFVRLSDGRILFAYTDYYGTVSSDHGTARISACISCDDGDTWGEPFVLITKDEEAQNIMSPAFVNLPDGNIGLFYLRKQYNEDGKLLCMPHFIKSDDDGKTWTERQCCSDYDGYYCGINDGAIVTGAGRIMWPVSYHGKYSGGAPIDSEKKRGLYVIYSDDNGETWNELPQGVLCPHTILDGQPSEPGIYEMEDGTLWLWFRTTLGFQYDTISTDGGNTWLPAEPNLRFTSPDSPMRVKKIKDIAVSVFNPIGYNCLHNRVESWKSPKRTPIVCSVSKDDAKSFCERGKTSWKGGFQSFSDNTYLLEDDLNNAYCYPSILETKDGFLVSYYHSFNTPYCLTASKIIKISMDELQ